VNFWREPESIDPVYFFHVKINNKNAYIRVHTQGSLEWATKKSPPKAG
jgi:hypothetical protein